VIQITVSKNSPLFGVQLHETNQDDRFLFARESVFFTTNGAKTGGKVTLPPPCPWVFLKEPQ
jgi:hypothetical protein